MANDTLGVAVVGCGIFGEIHAQTYSEFDRARLVAVCDVDAERAGKFAERFGCRAYTSVEEVAADPEVQTASVATPDFAHVEPCVTLAEAGKHILVEKPLATTVDDAERIARAASEAGVLGMVDFHNRYHPALRVVKGRIDSGDFGRPQMMYVRLSDRIEVATEWFKWSGRSGPEWFLGSHIADLAAWMFGSQPVRVWAEGRRDVLASRGIDCHDSMQIHLSFPEGFATLETSWIMPDTWPTICDFFVSIQTTSARADVDMNHQGVTTSDPERFERPMLYGRTPVGEETLGFFAFPIRDFVRSVLEGRPSPAPLADGVANVRTIAAAVESARTGQPVELGG
ncbi:MAG: Gfo/Idh/MocA family protein [Planctomycetota bacterium]|jgi:predicted dehydrogenase